RGGRDRRPYAGGVSPAGLRGPPPHSPGAGSRDSGSPSGRHRQGLQAGMGSHGHRRTHRASVPSGRQTGTNPAASGMSEDRAYARPGPGGPGPPRTAGGRQQEKKLPPPAETGWGTATRVDGGGGRLISTATGNVTFAPPGGRASPRRTTAPDTNKAT